MSKTDWIDKNNSAQCKWALNYLLKINNNPTKIHLAIEPNATSYNLVLTALSHAPNSLETKELRRLMMGAWRRRKNALSDNKIERSYNLNISAINKLEKLAKKQKMPLNKTVELLINRGFDFEEEAKRDAKIERERQKELRNQKSHTDRRTQEAKELRAVERTLAEVQRSFEELEKKYNDQLQLLHGYTIKLQDAEIFDKPMTKEQKKRRDQKIQEKQ
ncbi:hypothetical protein [Psychromonas antarctica]|uniref:hypothetical protein n=1 Tax=Psychromonas antarctica TaxID=67573 RepID=UPI001EE9315B|nr:hypothetical protein [Psychromonas antarctica]MCG6201051.1 hypothetical protein [Psychromonas antarctica]